MFLAGAVILFREGRATAGRERRGVRRKAAERHRLRAVLACFLVLFAAEWGDLSPAADDLAGREVRRPGSVFVGALGALLRSAASPCLVGRP